MERSKYLSVHRDIKNREEVYKILKDNNYEFISPEKYNFQDQIQMFFQLKKLLVYMVQHLQIFVFAIQKQK